MVEGIKVPKRGRIDGLTFIRIDFHLPFHSQHKTVNAAAYSKQGRALSFAENTLFNAHCHGNQEA